MIGGDSEFVLTCTHTHMFPYTHTHNSYLETQREREREITCTRQMGGGIKEKRKDSHLVSSKFFPPMSTLSKGLEFESRLHQNQLVFLRNGRSNHHKTEVIGSNTIVTKKKHLCKLNYIIPQHK